MDLVDKVMSLLFNMLSRLVIAFLPKEQSPFNFMAAVTTAVLLEPKKIKSDIVLLTKVHLVKTMVFSSSHVWM